MSLVNSKPLTVCPFGATCYRKNLLHFAEFSHPFNLLNPNEDDSDEEEATTAAADKSNKTSQTTPVGKKRKAESEDSDNGDKTEEYDSDDVR